MERRAESFLSRWLEGDPRKPLVVRGARQVGKTTLIRQFAAATDRGLLEVNLERHPELDRIFRDLDPDRIVSALESRADRRLDRAILFLDEIQAAPHALAALRYLYEQRPEIPVVAAGSLLEFTLANHAFPMPVGRIEYLHLGPMAFSEFLQAVEPDLAAHAADFDPESPPGDPTHERLVRRLRDYLFVGGLPEAVLRYRETGSFGEVARVHRSVAGTYVDDFSKYARSADRERLRRLFAATANWVGEKVRYSRLDPEGRAEQTSRAIGQLVRARICHRVTHSHCSGIPLAASAVRRTYKLVFMDVGLMNHLSGVTPRMVEERGAVSLMSEEEIAEQFIGQHLVAGDGSEPPSAHYWLRGGQSGNAEVNYVVAAADRIVPVEVKSGAARALKSLQVFAAARRTPLAVRFALNRPARESVRGVVRLGGERREVRFELLSLPLYAVESLPGILENLRRREGASWTAAPRGRPPDRPEEAREEPGRRERGAGSVSTGAAGPATERGGAVPGDTLTIHRWDETTQPGRVEIGILSGGTESESRSGRSLAVYPDTARRFGRLLDSRGFPLLPGERPSARLARLDRSGELLDFLESVSGEHPPDSELGDLLRVLREALRPAEP